VGWFARCHGWFMRLKDDWLTRLRASSAFHRARRVLRGMKRSIRQLRRRLQRRLRRRPARPFGHRHASHAARVLRRFVAQWRARKNKQQESP
jgi:hypothetical protein